jgi:hypothetical protein
MEDENEEGEYGTRKVPATMKTKNATMIIPPILAVLFLNKEESAVVTELANLMKPFSSSRT